MTDWDPIQAFLIEFARRLPNSSDRAHRALDEVEDHLRERVRDLCRQGVTPEEAAKTALKRFGTPSEILRQFELQAPFESEARAMLRYPLTLITALTSTSAALLFVFSWFDDAPPAGFAGKIGVAALILGYNAVLLLHLWQSQWADAWARWASFGGGLLMVAIGSAGIVWTLHLGQTTGDWESYGFVVGALLVLQGALAAAHIASNDRGAKLAA